MVDVRVDEDDKFDEDERVDEDDKVDEDERVDEDDKFDEDERVDDFGDEEIDMKSIIVVVGFNIIGKVEIVSGCGSKTSITKFSEWHFGSFFTFDLQSTLQSAKFLLQTFTLCPYVLQK